MSVPSSSDRPSPPDRRAALLALVAARRPGLVAVLDTEPCDELAGPWESFLVRCGIRQLRVVCYPTGTAIERSVLGIVVGQEAARIAEDPGGRVLAGIDWLMEEV